MVSRWVSYITHSPVMLTPLPRPLASHLGRQMGSVNDWTTCARPPLVSAEKTPESGPVTQRHRGNGKGENGSRNEPTETCVDVDVGIGFLAASPKIMVIIRCELKLRLLIIGLEHQN